MGHYARQNCRSRLSSNGDESSFTQEWRFAGNSDTLPSDKKNRAGPLRDNFVLFTMTHRSPKLTPNDCIKLSGAHSSPEYKGECEPDCLEVLADKTF